MEKNTNTNTNTNTINGKEYEIFENAPSPRIYGVVKQLISTTETEGKVIVEYFDHTTGEFETLSYTSEAFIENQALANKLQSQVLKEAEIKLKKLNKEKLARVGVDTNTNADSDTSIKMPRVETNKSEKLVTEADIKQFGNLWVYEINLPETGDTKPKHKHEFDHLHLIVKGKANFIVYDDKDENKIIHEETFTAPAWIEIPKNCSHQIKALRKNTIGYCIHPMRDTEDDLIDSNLRVSYAHVLSSDLKDSTEK